jgi:glyoxylase-like metal-dependent hydrolase (beta-lactamase superfamily II)
LPPIPGLTDGTTSNVSGVVLSHVHADHYGLIGLLHPKIPVFVGRKAETTGGFTNSSFQTTSDGFGVAKELLGAGHIEESLVEAYTSTSGEKSENTFMIVAETS